VWFQDERGARVQFDARRGVANHNGGDFRQGQANSVREPIRDADLVPRWGHQIVAANPRNLLHIFALAPGLLHRLFVVYF
jgi:hypothetical protein